MPYESSEVRAYKREPIREPGVHRWAQFNLTQLLCKLLDVLGLQCGFEVLGEIRPTAGNQIVGDVSRLKPADAPLVPAQSLAPPQHRQCGSDAANGRICSQEPRVLLG
jgi:hypothetical protein